MKQELANAVSALHAKVNESPSDACLIIVGTELSCMCAIRSANHLLVQAISAACMENPSLIAVLEAAISATKAIKKAGKGPGNIAIDLSN